MYKLNPMTRVAVASILIVQIQNYRVGGVKVREIAKSLDCAPQTLIRNIKKYGEQFGIETDVMDHRPNAVRFEYRVRNWQAWDEMYSFSLSHYRKFFFENMPF